MHPHLHRPSVVLWLEKLIVYMKFTRGVWFATHEEIAEFRKKSHD